MFECPMAATAFVTPLGLFFPLQQFGSFYGQWGNLFTWFAIGFAVSQYQGWRNSKKLFSKIIFLNSSNFLLESFDENLKFLIDFW